MTFSMRTLAAAVAIACSTAAAATELSGGITVVGQAEPDRRVHPEANGSFDLLVTHPTQNGSLMVYVEGSTAPRIGSVVETYADVNADAGTTGAEGNVQVSELKYRHEWQNGLATSVGLLDAAAYMDYAITANDENAQFLGATLVNNPTIAFPDYTLGVVIEKPFDEEGSQIYLLVAGSNGLHDNEPDTFSELLRVDRDGKGAFAAAGGRWVGAVSLEMGAWVSTADHPTLDGQHDNRKNYGAFGVAGYSAGNHGADLRLGWASPKVSEAAAFASVSYAYELEPFTLGVGASRTNLAKDATGKDSSQQEIYLRYMLSPTTAVTADVQRLENPNFADVDPVVVAGLRLRTEF